MDALTMQENDKELPYTSQNKEAAHMCGHDGHMACLIAFVPLLLANLDKIPSNRSVRLLSNLLKKAPNLEQS